MNPDLWALTAVTIAVVVLAILHVGAHFALRSIRRYLHHQKGA